MPDCECNDRPHAGYCPASRGEEQPRVLTTGRLDGLMITPIGQTLHFTIDTLPGLRLIIEGDAGRELRDALTIILGDSGPPVGKVPAAPSGWIEAMLDKLAIENACKPIHIDAPARARAPDPIVGHGFLEIDATITSNELHAAAKKNADEFAMLCPTCGGLPVDHGELVAANARIDQLEQENAVHESEGREARNTLARAIDKIDGGHWSALTLCATRAAELLGIQAARIDQLAAGLQQAIAYAHDTFARRLGEKEGLDAIDALGSLLADPSVSSLLAKRKRLEEAIEALPADWFASTAEAEAAIEAVCAAAREVLS